MKINKMQGHNHQTYFMIQVNSTNLCLGHLDFQSIKL